MWIWWFIFSLHVYLSSLLFSLHINNLQRDRLLLYCWTSVKTCICRNQKESVKESIQESKGIGFSSQQYPPNRKHPTLDPRIPINAPSDPISDIVCTGLRIFGTTRELSVQYLLTRKNMCATHNDVSRPAHSFIQNLCEWEANILFLKQDSSTFRQSSNPACGFSAMKHVRLCAIWPIGSSMNHIQGWKTVWMCYCHALEKRCLEGGEWWRGVGWDEAAAEEEEGMRGRAASSDETRQGDGQHSPHQTNCCSSFFSGCKALLIHNTLSIFASVIRAHTPSVSEWYCKSGGFFGVISFSH